jgi:hypothetical protein
VNDPRLASLNFEKLLVYEGGPPQPQPRYDPPLKCLDFCVSCEDQRFLDGANFKLRQISHGCDTADHETVLQAALPTPATGYIKAAILFLLESPGGQEHNGEEKPHPRLGVVKIPPTKSYYYAPDPDSPWDISRKDSYGPYFSYLMGPFGLRNVYITNAVKCGRVGPDGNFQPFQGGSKNSVEKKVRENRYKEFLKEEVSLVRPAIVFAFGGNAYACSDFLRSEHPQLPVIKLYHPKAWGYSMDQIKEINDPRVELGLRQGGVVAE